jgi:hypothetical protein
MALSLIDVSMAKNDPQFVKTCWNTYHCQSNITSSEGRIYGNYCKNRFCPTCLGIRKAELINKYLPILNTWEDPQFVTLTHTSCSGRQLKRRVNKVLQAFNMIKERAKKRHQRGKGIKIIGIKSLECNFNPKTKTYNPHLHIIVPDKATAYQIKREWLKIWTVKFAFSEHQVIRKVTNTEASLIEIIKYGTKIFTEPNLRKKSKKKGSHKIYVSALYNILAAMKGHRIFDRFGFNLPKTNKPIGGTITRLEDFDEWEYNISIGDWMSIHSGELLTEYKLPFELDQLLNNNIDVLLE